MTHKEILQNFADLSKEIEKSVGKDATVLPHKWDMIRRQKLSIDAMLKAFAHVQIQLPPFVSTAPKLETVVTPALEESRNLITVTGKKTKKNA